jgi:hypothetical protein
MYVREKNELWQVLSDTNKKVRKRVVDKRAECIGIRRAVIRAFFEYD